jgi:immunity protein 53 of polymorphic toxin system
MADELERVVRWYRAQCNGDWEHQNGIKLITLDNPGWSLDVNLTDTSAAGKALRKTTVERKQDDWIFYEAEATLFRGRCGPGNLAELLTVFLEFVEP